MAELEKVIRALENCTDEIKCRDCPWETCETFCLSVSVPLDLAKAALSLLNAQKPRVMMYDEMMKAEICFLEVKGIEEIDPFIRYEVDDKSYWTSPYTNSKDNPFELLAEQEEYLINARCWTSRPTDEQREAAKWDE